MTDEPVMYLLTKGNDIKSIYTDDFRRDIYPELCKGWHIIPNVKQGVDNGNVQTS